MVSAPPIRFFDAPTGPRVAYCVHGEGRPLVCPAWWVSHLERDWQDAGFRRFFEALAVHHTLVRYDRVGAGLSERERAAVTPDDERATLDALIAHLELADYSLFALSCAGPTALAHAAEHPDRVARLVLFNSFLAGGHVGDRSIRDALMALVRAEWGMGAKVIADLFAPELSRQDASALGKAQRAAADGEMAARLLALTFDADVSALAASVRVPTRVIHRRGDRTIRLAAGRALAAAVPGAELVLLEGSAHVPWIGDVDAAADAVLTFLDADAVRAAATDATGDARPLWRCEGEVWTLRYAGRTARLKTSRGLQDLAVLLSRPGEAVHVSELYGGEVAATSDAVLDERAIAAFRARVRELEEDIDEAQSRGLADAVEQLRGERDAIAKELAASVGLGGRRRALRDPAERARKAVSARVRAAIDKVEHVHPELARHLRACVRTGMHCSYDPRDATVFRVE